MELYQPILDNLTSLMETHSMRAEYAWNEEHCWPETDRFEMVMARDTAFELGARGKGSASYTCVTSQKGPWSDSKTIVIGKDLSQLSSDSSYARIVILKTDETLLSDTTTPAGKEAAFRTLQKLDFVKYHVFANGYMIRSSSESYREQVRVHKDALKQGITFEQLGNTFIRHYLEIDGVNAATILFITDPSVDYESLRSDARKVHEITMTLSRILEGMPTDCSLCSLKPICDEVEGMRQLHFGNNTMG